MIRKSLIVAILCLFTFQVLHAQIPGEISYKDVSVMPGGKKGERIRSLIASVNLNIGNSFLALPQIPHHF
jgi:hypothetical protein